MSLTVVGSIGVLVAFFIAVRAFADLASAATPGLGGGDAQLGFPTSVLSVSLFALVVAVGVSRLVGARFARWFSIAFAIILLAGASYQVWAGVVSFSPLGLLLTGLAAAAFGLAVGGLVRTRLAAPEPQVPMTNRAFALAIFLIVAGVLGWFASYSLTVEKVVAIIDPNADLSCNFSILVQCGTNLKSWQGSLFGFPNPLIGLTGFIAPIVVGFAILAGARFSRWFWIAFNIGIIGALGFVIWLIGQSIFILGTLCPWCMLVWSVTIPMFWLVTFYNLKSGNIPVPERTRRIFAGAYSYVPLITLLSLIVVALLAQVRLDAINYL